MQNKIDLKIDFATYESTKYAVVNWHYSKVMPAGKLVKLGVWENKVFVGVVVFGLGATNKLVQSYGLTDDQGCELVRVALKNHKTEVSRIISICIKFLKKYCSGIKLIVSFADPEQGHVGAIYQAGGWLYLGLTKAANEYVVNGKRMHGRSFRQKYGHLVKLPEHTIVKGSSKHRYLMPLCKELDSKIRPLSLKYPKRLESVVSDTSAFQVEEDGAIPISRLQEKV